MSWSPTHLILAAMLLGATVPAQPCIQFGKFASVGALPSNLQPAGTLHEASGIEASRINPGVLWVHDDSGNSNQIVALDATGQVVQRYELQGIFHSDWEDIAIGPGPEKGRDYLYIADIGNNNLTKTSFALIRVPEPITPATPGATIRIPNAETFSFRYPNQTHDAETLLIDPVDGRCYVLTKEAKPSTTGYLYSYPPPFDSRVTKTLILEQTFSHPAPRFSGGDVSSDGRWIVVRNNDDVFTFLRGIPTSGFGAAFVNLFCVFDGSKQGNAEAITISADGTKLYTTSEGAGAGIWRSDGRLPSGTVAMPSWWTFGSESESWLWGSAGLTLDTFPALGRSVTATLWNARPNATAAIGFGASPIPDGRIPLAGGWLHVLPILLVMVQTDAAGHADLLLGTPSSTNLLGMQLHAQAAIEDIGSVYGLTLTRGLSLQVGR